MIKLIDMMSFVGKKILLNKNINDSPENCLYDYFKGALFFFYFNIQTTRGTKLYLKRCLFTRAVTLEKHGTSASFMLTHRQTGFEVGNSRWPPSYSFYKVYC